MSLRDGLVSYWSLEESSGNRIDRRGLNDLVPSGSPGGTAGKIGNAAELNAAAKFLSCSAASYQPGSGDFTFSGWFRLPSPLSDNTNVFLVGNYNSLAVNNRGWGFQIQAALPGQALWRVFVSSDGTGTIPSLLTLNGATTSNRDQTIFRHWVLRKSGPTISFFLDNTLLDSGTLATVFAPDEPFRINGMGQGNQARSVVADECGYWNRGLSDSEIAELWNGGNGLSYSDFGGGSAAAVHFFQFGF